MKIHLAPPFSKGEITPPFDKACLPVGRGGREGFCERYDFFGAFEIGDP